MNGLYVAKKMGAEWSIRNIRPFFQAYQGLLLVGFNSIRGFQSSRFLETTAFNDKDFDEQNEHTPDYYSTLGIHRSADLDTIKRAYYNLAKKFHPDTNKSREARFMFEFVAEAYDVLSDSEKRRNYDTHGFAKTFGGTTSYGPHRPTGHQTRDSEELFMKIFGESSKEANESYQSEAQFNAECCEGHDATREVIMNLTFEEAAKGCIRDLHLTLRIICLKCRGSKSELGYQANICPYCEGTGFETERLGGMVTRKTCSYCDGSKMFNKWKCTECAGTGQMIKAIPDYRVTIPPGCDDGQLLRIPIDEKYLKVTVAHHKYFFIRLNVEKSTYFKGRDGYDLFSEADLSVSQALLGGVLHVRGLHKDNLRVDLPQGSLEGSHANLVVQGEGITMPDGFGSGNHFIEVGIQVPKELTSRQKDLMTKLFEGEEINDGLVENGVDAQDSHRYRVNVVEPGVVTRPFNAKKSS